MPLFKLSDGQVHFSSLLITFSTAEICIEIQMMHIHRPYNIPISQIVLFQGPFLFFTIILTIPVLKVPISFALQAPHWNVFRVVEEVSKPQGHSNNKTSWLYASIPQNLFSVSKNPEFVLSSLKFSFPSCSQPKYPPKKWFINNSAPGETAPTPHPSTKEEKKKRCKLHLPCSRVTVLRQTRYPIVAPSPGLRKRLGLNRMYDLDQIAYELCTKYIEYTVCI